MLKNIILRNCFTHHNRVIDFTGGLTGITGKNGIGKSLILEMAQYALWGTQALRGKAEDYKKLEVTLEFVVRGRDLRVTRTPRTVLLEENGVPLATGTKPVNQKIREIFGYSYEVFKVANCINQGEIEQLGKMKPTERKRLVDETVGLNVLDDLDKYIADVGKSLTTRVETLESVLSEPVEPTKPEGYAGSEALAASLVTLQGLDRECHALTQTAARTVSWPVEPVAPKVPVEALGQLQSQQARRTELATLITRLNQDISKAPKITMTQEEIDRQRGLIEVWGRAQDRDRLKAKLVERICPACDHHWHEGPDLSHYQDLPEHPEKPAYTQKQLNDAQAALGGEALVNLAKAELVKLAEEFQGIPDHAQDIQDIIQYQQATARYQGEKARAEKAQEEIDEAKEALNAEKFQGLQAKLAVVQQAHTAAVVYEANLRTYTEARERYEAGKIQIEGLRQEKGQWDAARKAVKDLRAKVKAYLLPSLNQVSSILVNEMTGGEIPDVKVDDAFEITAGSQRLETLSGAGISVANLALRIGLGQVLTHKTFGCLMADEIDASCDNDRAKYIAQCLQRLTKHIPQIIQVSHKQGLEADNYVRL